QPDVDDNSSVPSSEHYAHAQSCCATVPRLKLTDRNQSAPRAAAVPGNSWPQSSVGSLATPDTPQSGALTHGHACYTHMVLAFFTRHRLVSMTAGGPHENYQFTLKQIAAKRLRSTRRV
ncbi:MAG: hypothetical protein AAF558_15105, partial [Verrucomicrobiota bacterium]